ncbi:MAG: acyl-CoA/acyl-ACP dehydrogenase [Proteobacteria bacterium]|nr:acyl-CoA/acyl-ACP dehydrogenase [Pseudomonadota bacterium]
MDFAFSEEQDEFREMLARFLAERAPVSEARRVMESPESYDATLWKQMAGELALPGLAVPEAHGGQGFGLLELGIAAEELGRVLYAGPFFSSTCLATPTLLHVGGEADHIRWLPSLASGESIATLALLEDGGSWDPADVALEATSDGSDCRLTGAKALVSDAEAADLFLVVARQPGTRGRDGLTLLAVPRDAAGLEVTALESLDGTRGWSRVAFRDTPAHVVGTPGEAAAGLELALAQATALLACECAGGAKRALDLTVAYVGERVQFARPVGSFQAVKHRCAEALLDVQSAVVTAQWASWVAEEDPAQAREAAHVAKAVTGDAFVRTTQAMLQLHGGIGFTWEADVHLYVKRARTTGTLLGGAREHRARMARELSL